MRWSNKPSGLWRNRKKCHRTKVFWSDVPASERTEPGISVPGVFKRHFCSDSWIKVFRNIFHRCHSSIASRFLIFPFLFICSLSFRIFIFLLQIPSSGIFPFPFFSFLIQHLLPLCSFCYFFGDSKYLLCATVLD